MLTVELRFTMTATIQIYLCARIRLVIPGPATSRHPNVIPFPPGSLLHPVLSGDSRVYRNPDTDIKTMSGQSMVSEVEPGNLTASLGQPIASV